jgi:hypothetical protein
MWQKDPIASTIGQADTRMGSNSLEDMADPGSWPILHSAILV